MNLKEKVRPKKPIYIVGILGGFLLAILIFSLSSCSNKNKEHLPEYIKKEEKKIKKDSATSSEIKAFCPLCGIETKLEHVLRRPLAVMIENHPRARPQSGLDKACIVYEAPVEGGITRFMALYLHNDPEMIGPVRSARPYFITLMLEYDAVYVHCGQSWEAFGMIYRMNFPTINEMWRPQAFWRSKKRRSPHNLYTNSYKLRKIIKEKRWDKYLKVSHFLFSENPPAEEKVEKANEISIIYSKKYKVLYKYEPKTDSYLRFIGKTPHLDLSSGKQIKVRNIIIQYVEANIIDEEGRYDLGVIGEGEAQIFRGGKVIKGKWFKKDPYAMTTFFDLKDNLIIFLPGPIWIQILPTVNSAVYVSSAD